MRTELHASCASLGGAAVLLLGPSGSGKSDLLLRLLDRGFTLVADDRVVIEAGMAAPAPGLEGLVEMRGLGILRQPWQAPAQLVLAIVLSPEAPRRLPDRNPHVTPGVTLPADLPVLELDPRVASAPLFVARALACLRDPSGMHTGAFA
ncbi:HPr kinase/phosphorylase [Lichenicoccus roseus]|uniref:Phosphotransferase n=1 Tax=Lichenicoccus roseus TaxID=2683649 RepID=A0A5R9J2M1_9PROT|nr:phosphotransferase [Lichenicoccus roseus]TLU71874.1 phosphotransferase [Lichenicoccus roseus]